MRWQRLPLAPPLGEPLLHSSLLPPPGSPSQGELSFAQQKTERFVPHFEADASKWKGRRSQHIWSFRGSYNNRGSGMVLASSDAGSWLLRSKRPRGSSPPQPHKSSRRGGHWPSACSAFSVFMDERCSPLLCFTLYSFPGPGKNFLRRIVIGVQLE